MSGSGEVATWAKWGGAAVAAVVVAACFGGVLSADFVRFDDPKVLLENSHVQSLSAENIRWMFTHSHMGHYQPLTWLSYALEHAVWGLEPRGYHAVNLGLHAVNCVLVYLLALRVFAKAREGAPGVETGGISGVVGAMAAAVLWGVHPLRVESVAWVTERRDVLSAALLLGATLAYVRVGNGRGGRARWSAIATCLVLLLLSLLSKAWGMSFFVIALVLDVLVLKRLSDRPWRWVTSERTASIPVLLEKVPMALLGVGFAVIAAAAQRQAVAAKTLEEWGIGARLLQALHGLGFYLRKTVWPTDLSVLYELPPQSAMRIGDWRVALPAISAVVALAMVPVAVRRAPGLAAAAIAYVVLLLPVLGLMQSGDQFVADRYSYLAMVGWMILIGAVVARWATRPAMRVGAVVGTGVVCAVLGVRTAEQCRVWRSTESLWGHAAKVTPTSSVLLNYGMELARTGRADEALAPLGRAVQLDAGNATAWVLLGNIHRDRRRLVEAEAAYLEAAKSSTQGFMGRVNLGALYLQYMNKPKEGVEQMRLAVADVARGGRRPITAMPYLALARALQSTGDAEGAKAVYRQALAFDDVREDARKALIALGETP